MKRKALIILALSLLATVFPSCREIRKILPAGEPNVIYHFDMSNLSKYTFDEIYKIFD